MVTGSELDRWCSGTVMRAGTLRRYAHEAGLADVEVVEDGYGFWRFYELHRS